MNHHLNTCLMAAGIAGMLFSLSGCGGTADTTLPGAEAPKTAETETAASDPGQIEETSKEGGIFQMDVSSIREIEIQIEAGDVFFTTSDQATQVTVRWEQEGVRTEYDEWEEELSITYEDSMGSRGNKIYVEVPTGHSFREIEAEVEDGSFHGEGLLAEMIKLEAERGTVDCLVNGKKDSYRAQIEMDGGALTYGGENAASTGEFSMGRADAPKILELECKDGNVEIRFEENT